MEPEVTLRIVIEQPPKGVDLGLQKGRGSAYETVQRQRSQGSNLEFEFTVAVKAGHQSTPVFGGPFIQGPPRQQFVYLDVGTYAGQADSCWSRRIKVPLSGITQHAIVSEIVLEARIPGAARDGGPACGTVEPIDGWKPARRRTAARLA
jgi:hypothetical protein